MRKRIIIPSVQKEAPAPVEDWLDLDRLAEVEITSEDREHPIESALIPGRSPGWRAAGPGEQTIRLLFDEPQSIRHVRLVFQENERQRTQQFVLRWSSDGGRSYREIVRQQYNFSPPRTTEECEDYDVELEGVTSLERIIVPDLSGVPVCASLAQLRLV